MLSFLAGEVAEGHRVLPPPSNVLRAFRQPLADVRVLIVGQDPYPTPGHAVGLAFSVDGRTRPIPRSLANIYKELEADLGLPSRVHGDLGAWAGQGVLLLNRVLSVREGAAGSHRGKGWEAITTAAVAAVAGRRTADGGRLPSSPSCGERTRKECGRCWSDTPVVASVHPSPLSASRGFFGSRPFSRANALLKEQGAGAVDWELPAVAPAPGATNRSAAGQAWRFGAPEITGSEACRSNPRTVSAEASQASPVPGSVKT